MPVLLNYLCRALVLLYLYQLLTACTAIAVADRVIPKQPQDLPGDIKIDVPFIKQTDHHCGPASLAMIANYYGHPVRAEQVADLVFIPTKKGSLQVEMQAAARSLGFVAFSMNMDASSLRAEIIAERPVMILQNLAFSIYPVWHYSVVTGVSPDNEYFLLHSGRHKYYRSDWTTLENTWRRGQYWALVVLPSGELPVSINEDQAVNAAIALEKIGNYRAAQQTYTSIIQRWPESFIAHVGLANSHMQLKEPLAASKAYRRALELDAQSAEVLNNFAYSAFELGCEVSALHAASCAMRIDGANHKQLTATLRELKSLTNNPRHHAMCPDIRCTTDSFATTNHYMN